MLIQLSKVILLQALLLTLLVSCSKTVIDAIDENKIQDGFSILSSVEIEDGNITFFERSTYKDIGVAFVNPSMSKEKTIIGGYLDQNNEETNWHYSSSDLDGNPYSVYYGTLDSYPKGRIFIDLGTGDNKEATVIKASSKTVWYLILKERIEVNELEVIITS